MSLAELLLGHPFGDDDDLLHTAHRTVTAGAARSTARQVAEDLGPLDGTAVAVQLPNGPELVTTMVGVWLAGVGALGGWGASMAGLVDLITVGRIRRLVTAWGHAIIAVMMLSIASLNWSLRWGKDAGAAIDPWCAAMTLFTAGFIGIAAYLGGRLVYEKAVAVDTDA